MPNIAILGSGVAGVHLGLLLRSYGFDVTVYTQQTIEEQASGPLLNTVAHHHRTRAREKMLGVNFWDDSEAEYRCHHHYVGGDHPLSFRGDFTRPSLAVDYRLYLPRLRQALLERGGKEVLGRVEAGDLEILSERHALVVVATGARGLADRFPIQPAHSPFDGPQRRLSVGLYRGVAASDPQGVTLSISPGQGELIEIPIETFEGRATALLFENIPGGDLEVLAEPAAAADLKAYQKLVIEKLRVHHPTVFARVDVERFELTRPIDLLQGGVTPRVRRPHARLANGKLVAAVGDAYAVCDPCTGQGANSASYSAFELGKLIHERPVFDDVFAQTLEQRTAAFVAGVASWTNFTLMPPPPHFIGLLVSMAQKQDVADAFTENFNYPDRQWEAIATPRSTARFLERFEAEATA